MLQRQEETKGATKVAKIQNSRRFSYGPQLQLQNKLEKVQRAEEIKEQKIKRIRKEARKKRLEVM